MYELLKPLPLLLTLTQIEKYVGLPKSTMTKWLMKANTNNFPAQKIGGVWRVNKLKLIDWLEKDHANLRVS